MWVTDFVSLVASHLSSLMRDVLPTMFLTSLLQKIVYVLRIEQHHFKSASSQPSGMTTEGSSACSYVGSSHGLSLGCLIRRASVCHLQVRVKHIYRMGHRKECMHARPRIIIINGCLLLFLGQQNTLETDEPIQVRLWSKALPYAICLLFTVDLPFFPPLS